MKSVISDNKIIPFLPCYKRTSQLHETKVSDLQTVYMDVMDMRFMII